MNQRGSKTSRGRRTGVRARGSARHTNQKDDVGVQVDPKLNAVHNLLPGPAWNPKVGDQSHDRHGKKPGGGGKHGRLTVKQADTVHTEKMRTKATNERGEKWRGDAKREDKDWRRCVDNEVGDGGYKKREMQE